MNHSPHAAALIAAAIAMAATFAHLLYRKTMCFEWLCHVLQHNSAISAFHPFATLPLKSHSDPFATFDRLPMIIE